MYALCKVTKYCVNRRGAPCIFFKTNADRHIKISIHHYRNVLRILI